MKSLRLLLFTATSFVAIATALRAQTVVTWGSATTISGDGDVVNNGSVLGAWAFTASDSTSNPTVNGVTFASTTFTSGDGQYLVPFGARHTAGTSTTGISVAVLDNYPTAYAVNSPSFGAGTGPVAGLSADYQTLLGGAVVSNWGSAKADTALQFTGLTIGQSYQIQLWVNRSGSSETEIVSDYNGHSVTLLWGDGTAGSVGQYVTGSFQALSSTLTINMQNTPGIANGLFDSQINAASISAIPEPSTYTAIFGTLALGAAGVREHRRRKRAA